MKAKKIITMIVTVLAVAMVAFSGVMKLLGGADGIKMLEAVGVGQYRLWLGLAEITLASLFAMPRTMRVGFILLSCYFSGAMATELSHGMPLNALVPMILIWVAMIMRDKAIFFPSAVLNNNK